ncbi:16S rRNA (uracil(1498)-N(3))-methyltransferase [bacterium]|nr:16S rRNA (uracil(1498)-N(3))-methyltransferase [bacterium]
MLDLSYKAKVRIYFPKKMALKQTVILSSKQVHYLTNVMRKKKDDIILIFNNVDGEFLAKITKIYKKNIILDIIKKTRDIREEIDLWILFSPVKKSPTELIIQKATELGASKIFPVITDRTITKQINLDRLLDIAIEASEQCERLTIPEIFDLKKLKDLIESWDKKRIILYGDETIRKRDEIKFNFQNLNFNSLGAILIGPEGGFSNNEINYLRKKTFIKPIDLGPRILRSDTAVISTIVLWHCLNGDMKKYT